MLKGVQISITIFAMSLKDIQVNVDIYIQVGHVSNTVKKILCCNGYYGNGAAQKSVGQCSKHSNAQLQPIGFLFYSQAVLGK